MLRSLAKKALKIVFTVSYVLLTHCGQHAPSLSEVKGTWQPAFYYCGPTHDPVHCASLIDGNFEQERTREIGNNNIWKGNGPDPKGFDINLGYAHGGANNAWIRSSSRNWNSIYQYLTIQPNHNYALHVFLRATPNIRDGYFTVRNGTNVDGPINTEKRISGDGNYREHVLLFYSGANRNITIYAGFWGVGVDAWMQMDDFYLEIND